MMTLVTAALFSVATGFIQVAPKPATAGTVARSEGETRAVLLIHGLRGSAFREKDVAEVHFHDWQQPDSEMVKALAKDSDVFAWSYGQNESFPEISALPGIGEAVTGLKDMGYTEIVLVGHSAGGILAREFVEDHPESAVTKVIQVCSPNLGSRLGKAARIARDPHEAFVRSLAADQREKSLAERAEKKIPEAVQFVCVIGDGGGLGDFVVRDDSQWPPDLRAQGIPAVQERTAHFSAMRSERMSKRVAELVREDQPRWDAAKVKSASKQYLEFETWQRKHGD